MTDLDEIRREMMHAALRADVEGDFRAEVDRFEAAIRTQVDAARPQTQSDQEGANAWVEAHWRDHMLAPALMRDAYLEGVRAARSAAEDALRLATAALEDIERGAGVPDMYEGTIWRKERAALALRALFTSKPAEDAPRCTRLTCECICHDAEDAAIKAGRASKGRRGGGDA